MRTPTPKIHCGLFTQGLLLLALLVIAYPGVFLRGESLIPGDTLFQINPWKSYQALPAGSPDNRLTLDSITAMNTYYALSTRALKQSEWPLWNHLEFGGMPLLANCQSAVLYPPRLVHLFFDLPTATTLYILLKLWLCGLTAYLCARVMQLGVGAARFASVGWMLCAYNVVWAYWPLPDVSVWAPVIVLGIEFILSGLYRRGFYVLTGGATMILLAGHPETAFVFGAGAGVYFFARLLLERRGRTLWQPMAAAGAAWIVALLMAGAQLVPFLEYAANIHTHERSLVPSPGTVIGFWLPRFFGIESLKNFWGTWNSNITMMVYPGILTWVAISLLGASLPKDKPARARAVSLLISTVVFVLLAFSVPPFNWLVKLPPFSVLYLYYCLAWFCFGLIFSAAIALDQWLAQSQPMRRLLWVLPTVLVATTVIAGMYWFNASFINNLRLNSLLTEDILIAIFVVLAGVAILAISATIPSASIIKKAAPTALALLLAADLLHATRNVRPTCPPASLYMKTELTDYLAAQPGPVRVNASSGLIPSGILPMYGIEEWGGYDGLYPIRMMYFRGYMGTELWNAMEPVCSITHYLNDVRVQEPMFPKTDSAFEHVATLNDIEVYKNTAAFPRAFLVPRATVVGSIDEMFSLMKKDAFDPANEVLLERPLLEPLPSQNGNLPVGTASVTHRSSTRQVVTASANQACILVLSEGYFPGWKATVNGKPTDVMPAYYAFRAVYLPAGEHTVVFSYEPRSFTIGLIVSAVALLGLVVSIPLTRRAA